MKKPGRLEFSSPRPKQKRPFVSESPHPRKKAAAQPARKMSSLESLEPLLELIAQLTDEAFEAGMRAGKEKPVFLARSPKGREKRKPPRM